MKQGIWYRLDGVARSIYPVFITILLIIAGMVPLNLPMASAIGPALPLVAVYYWTVHKPHLMPLWTVFLIGLLQDLLSGGPIGVSIIMLLTVHAVITRQRRFFTSAAFTLIWSIFMLVAAGALTLGWLLTCLAYANYVNPQPVIFQYLMTLAFYPCFAWVMVQGRRLFKA